MNKNNIVAENLLRLCSTPGVTLDNGKRIDMPNRLPLAVFNIDGSFHVTNDTCTHANASLSDGYVENGKVECPIHAGTFCIETGQALTFAAVISLKIYSSQVLNGAIYVDAFALE